jgi:hypothetical protein
MNTDGTSWDASSTLVQKAVPILAKARLDTVAIEYTRGSGDRTRWIKCNRDITKVHETERVLELRDDYEGCSPYFQ